MAFPVGWVEVIGDSGLVNDELEIPGGGLVATVASHPTNHVSGIARISIPDASIGQVYRIIINYLDVDNYLFGELAIEGGGQATLSLYARVGGVNNLIHAVPAGWIGYPQGDSLRICRTLEGASVYSSVSTLAWGCVEDNGGRRAGIANGGSSDILVDDFRFEEQNITNIECPICHCECDEHCLPKTLTLTLFGSDCCSCWDGTTFILTFQDDCLPEFVWYGEGSTCNWDECANPGGSHNWKFVLVCGGGGSCASDEWELCFAPPVGVGGPPGFACSSSCPGGSGSGICSISLTCDPFELIYDTQNVHGSPPPEPPDSCAYSFKITE